ncbi:hypothetical protein AVDCRST_MAG81-3385 [uncultured Synechococcales cyanobacterium]|uniref:Uncharacterized protein n=1 Tax=uncultured Synechococcales cyanobacterium TaxID=1936017 RepID=A0A6J4VP57_9CYAN|nr:hypothetical protein AVDCRST_MAG81-3385 [uncultured Synechococcales cyanobacterium]
MLKAFDIKSKLAVKLFRVKGFASRNKLSWKVTQQHTKANFKIFKPSK